MLDLKNIRKEYNIAGNPFNALNDINLSFKENEFVSILGPSGCGKTTMLNLIGGLDRYTEGDLLIDGKSTKNFKDSDWDAYRNSTIGFVFQNYNLISHLSVLDNVEIAFRLSGVSSKESKERSIKVLEDVGLKDQVSKKPNQLSGGQMQRVAIARALVNNPKILLADEPTGALDTKTSDQIMKLIKEISKDRLVIMVTHNSNIANEYSDRIIKLLDGEVIEDSKPINLKENFKEIEKLKNKKTSMSYLTALKTSFKNLLTKKGRTIITAFAGSIGIIGIALVLAISSGMRGYVDTMQSDTLASFPITISDTYTDFSNFSPFQTEDTSGSVDETMIYSSEPDTRFVNHINVIDQDYLDYINNLDNSLYNDISYGYDLNLQIITMDYNQNYIKSVTNASNGFYREYFFNELPDSQTFVESQYRLINGIYPTNKNQAVLIIDEKNGLSNTFLESIGMEIKENYSFSDFIGKTFKFIPNNIYYIEDNGLYSTNNNFQEMYNSTDADIETISIVGIMKVRSDATSNIVGTGIAYSREITNSLINSSIDSNIVIDQRNNPTIDIISGEPFTVQYTYETRMKRIGATNIPTSINIFPVSFDAKDSIKIYLDQFNDGKETDLQILYTDLGETISTSISDLINTVTIILSAFAGISLVVSSIMIGIITYVSVVERTKEIGIMRSLGARKKDVSRIFNAETFIIGFCAGVIGVIIAIILTIPINIIIEKFIVVTGFSYLPIIYAILLIILSMILTLVAGLIPSRIASKKDPVIALRTE